MTENYNPNSHDYSQFRRNVVKDAIDNAFKPAWKPERYDPVDKLLAKAEQITQTVRLEITPILKAGGAKDRNALQSLIAMRFTEEFAKQMSEDERLVLLTIIHTEIALSNINRDHWGLNTPDGIEPSIE